VPIKVGILIVDKARVNESSSPRMKRLFRDVRDVVLVVTSGVVTEVHGPFESMFGFEASTIQKGPISEVLANIDGDFEPLLDEATKRRGEAVSSSVRLMAGATKTHWVELTVRETTLGRTNLLQEARGHIVTIRDRTAETELRMQISRLAASDPVTELANPTRFRELLNASMHRTMRTGEHLAVLAIRIASMDSLRSVFDPTQMAALQVELAQRISNTLRVEDVVGHLEADEFGVVLSGMAPKIGRAYAVDVADRITVALSEPVHVAGTANNIVANIGIAHGTRGKVERSAVDLITEARNALAEVEANADRWKNLKHPS
jgi:diguanylate cyclase (GGDEF)-like protein